MAIQFLLRIYSPDEIHVLPGHPSWDLIKDCYSVSQDSGPILDIATFLSVNPTAQFSFTPKFNGLLAPVAAGEDALYEAFNVRVNLTKGRIEAIAGAAGTKVRNFLIEVKLTHDGTTLTDLLRVNMHERIEEVWLTPDDLRIHRKGSGVEETVNNGFSFRARFDDGTVGDITAAKGIVWTGRMGATSMDISASDPDSFTVPVQAAVTIGSVIHTDVAHVMVGKPWAHEAAPRARLVAGSAVPTAASLSSKPNVLFIGDGVPVGSEEEFHALAVSMVKDMSQPLYKPYDLLKPAMHFWSVVCPSPHGQVPISNEVFQNGSGATAVTGLVHRPRVPERLDGTPFTWVMRELFYAVGLPVPADALDAVPKREESEILQHWNQVFGWKPAQHTGDIDALVNEWRSFAHRGLADLESTGALTAIASGGLEGSPDVTFLADRGRNELDRFLERIEASVQAAGGGEAIVPIGHLWASTDLNGDVADPPADRTLIVLLMPQVGRAANGLVIQMPLLEQPNVVRLGTTSRYKLAPFTYPRSATEVHTKTIVHELSHSFDLGDEYGEMTGPPDPGMHLQANLQLDMGAMVPVGFAGNPNPAMRIHGDEIAWRWPRARHAAVVNGPITGTLTDLVVPLADGNARGFRGGALCVLRKRHPRFGPRKSTLMSKLLRVKQRDTDAIILEEAPSTFRFRNTATPAQLLTDFPIGSVLLEVEPASTNVFDLNTYPIAEMVAKNVKDYITQHCAPLTNWTETSQGVFESSTDDDHLQVPNLKRGTNSIIAYGKNAPRVVGLYGGGRRYHKGVFHPAGHCLMRHTTHAGTREFCAVCRYILVDIIDPTQHGANDKEYDKHYPLA